MAGDHDTVTVSTLLKYSEEQFSTAISNMAPVILMTTISGLQQEMRSEQENFNSLGQQLDNVKDKRSQQFKQISKDLMASQTRLTLLMNRSMKCFSQQSSKSQTQTLDRRNHSSRVERLRANSDANLLSPSLSAYTPEPRERSSSFTETEPPGKRHSVNIVSLSRNFQNDSNFGVTSPQQNNKIQQKPSEQSKANNNHVNSNHVQSTTTATDNDSSKISMNFSGNQNVKTVQQNQRVIHESNPVRLNSQSESFSVTKPSAKSVSNIVTISKDPPQKSEGKKIVYKIPQVSALRQAFEDGKVDGKTVNVKIPNGLSHSATNGLQHGTKSKFVTPSSGTVNVVQNGTKSKTVSQNIIPREDSNSKSHSETKTFKIDLDSSFNPKKYVQFENPAVTDRKSILKSLEENTVQLSKNVPENVNIGSAGNSNDQPKVLLPRKSSLKRRKPEPSNMNSGQQPSAVVQSSTSWQGPKTDSPAVIVNSSSNLNEQTTKSAPAKAAHTSKDTVDGVTVKSLPVVEDAVPVTSIDDIVIEERSENGPVDKTSPRLNISSVETKSVDSSKYTVQASGNELRDEKKSGNDDDVVPTRVHLKSWNPIKLLETLYATRLMDETVEDLSHCFISMEGIMEKLPQGKRKSTLLKTWKRRYFKATDGWLHYFENNNFDKPTHSIQLMGGTIEVLDSRIIGIDDGRGHYLMVRCPNATDFENWRVALESQTTDNAKAVYVRPVINSALHPNKRVVIIDIGSTSVRAGVLGEKASLPQLFFPTVVAKNKTTGEHVVGFDAYRPEIRDQSTLYFPVRPSIKVDKGKSNPFNIDMELLPFIFDKIFKDLQIDSKSYWVLLSTPQMLADKLKAEMMHTLTRRCGVAGVCIAPQSLLAMYSYKATSGIIVDIGERIEILPISDGYIVDGGVTRHPFGGEKVMDSLGHSLTQQQYHLYTEVEHLIVRHVMEKTCYIASNYNEETKQFTSNPKNFKASVDLSKYNLPAGTYKQITHDDSRFKSAEGFFNTDLWGLDYPKLHKLVHKAIQECPMDNRREMCRSIYLSGGVTMLPGFAERLQAELTKLVPKGLTIQVHASPHRYHAAFIGGCTLAAQDLFEQTCITREQWNKNGTKELKKWHMPS